MIDGWQRCVEETLLAAVAKVTTGDRDITLKVTVAQPAGSVTVIASVRAPRGVPATASAQELGRTVVAEQVGVPAARRLRTGGLSRMHLRTCHWRRISSSRRRDLLHLCADGTLQALALSGEEAYARALGIMTPDARAGLFSSAMMDELGGYRAEQPLIDLMRAAPAMPAESMMALADNVKDLLVAPWVDAVYGMRASGARARLPAFAFIQEVAHE